MAFYGVGLDQRLDILRTIKQPVQMHFRDKDAHVSPAAVAMLEDMANDRPNIEVLRYAEGGHAFFRLDLKNEESKIAYGRMQSFLDRVLTR